MYYTATCSNSNANPHAVRFFTDAACKTVSPNAAPLVDGTPAGTLAALEYPCVSLSATTSISAGARNEYVYGIGSVLLWTKNGDCQGMTNGDSTHPVVCPQDVTPCCAFAVLDLVYLSHRTAIELQHFFCERMRFYPSNAVQLLPQRRRVRKTDHQPTQRVLCRGPGQRCIEIMEIFSQSKFSGLQRRCNHNGHDYQRQDIRRSTQ